MEHFIGKLPSISQEVSKTPITLGTYGSLSKIRKGCFGSLNLLGVKSLKFYDMQLAFCSCRTRICKKKYGLVALILANGHYE
jgi:hypothetical protein